MLPSVPIARSLVDVGVDEKVSVRALTSPELAEIKKIHQKGDETGAEIALLAFGTDNDRDAARAWYETAPRSAVQAILDELEVLIGGRVAETSKSVPAGVHDGGASDV